MALGDNIKKTRERKGMTQEELASRIYISKINMSYFESNSKMPSVATLVNIADVLECSVDSLLDRNIKN